MQFRDISFIPLQSKITDISVLDAIVAHVKFIKGNSILCKFLVILLNNIFMIRISKK